MLYLDKLYFKVPPFIYHTQAIKAVAQVWLASSHGGYVSMCINSFFFLFARLYLHMLLLKYFLECLEAPVRNVTHIYKPARGRTHTLNRMPSFFSDACRAQCECQPVAIPLHSCPSVSSQGPPVVPQGPGACASTVPLRSTRMPGSGLGKAAVFCVQWTAGTFQITAEFKVSTKAASTGFLFVYPCLLMSSSIRPNWFVSTSIHTIS